MLIERLEDPGQAESDALLEVWESAVRATHTFLSEADIVALRPWVLEAFGAVSIWIAREEGGRIAAFSGLAGNRLEMLFVRAGMRGRGVGSLLLRQALAAGVTELDVNEQNPRARGFYERRGFKIIGRSDLDGQGRPFPLLHMRFGG